MCISNLISAAAGLGGLALSGQGAAQNAAAQASQQEATALDNVLRAQASNQVLSQFLNYEQGNQAANNAAVQSEYASLDPATYAANQATEAQQMGAAATGAIKAGLSATPAGYSNVGQQLGLTGTDPNVANTIANRTNTLVGQQDMNAQNYANLASYGQNLNNLNLAEQGANRSINNTNEQTQMAGSILPTNEQNAALQASIYVPPANTTTGTTEEGLGALLGSQATNIGNTLGGPSAQSAVSNGAQSLGNYFGSLLSSSPTYSGGGIGMA